jgi:hypothetical protein
MGETLSWRIPTSAALTGFFLLTYSISRRTNMAYYVVNHNVNVFVAWKKVYDEFESTREQYGVKEHYALQSVEDSNHPVRP